jgi:hypothetical protein
MNRIKQMIERAKWAWRLWLAALVVLLSGAALAQIVDGGIVPSTIPDPSTSFGAYAQLVFQAVQSSNWKVLVIIVMVGLTYVVKEYGGRAWPWLDTDRGGAVLALAVGVLGSMANALAASAAISPQLLLNGFLMGVTAAGGYNVVKKILFPQDMAPAAPAPAPVAAAPVVPASPPVVAPASPPAGAAAAPPKK